MKAEGRLVPIAEIESRIYLIRGERVMLDLDLADLYDVSVGALNRSVRRNSGRFPSDFMFQLTKQEVTNLKCQIGISIGATNRNTRKSLQPLDNISRYGGMRGYGGRRHYPYAFTEQGVAMLSSILRSERAVAVNVEIMRAFVHLRRMMLSHEELSRELRRLEKKYDGQFKIVFDAIRNLMMPPEKKRRRIGFRLE
jgi:hypothetical protein